MQTVPCIIADDLTEEQIKAFRLADNKVSELASWDFDLLDNELNDIFNINMGEFGFENNSFDENALTDLFTDTEQKEKKPKQIQCPHCGEWFEV